MSCVHNGVDVINPFEFIRKYRCRACGLVMMCECDREFGTRFLPHQLSRACDLETQQRIPVDAGFQKTICNTCRGLPEVACPVAEQYGRTSKIARYYWREIYFETTKRLAKELGIDAIERLSHEKELRDRIEREVTCEMLQLHEKAPKYKYVEQSANDVLTANAVEIINLRAEHIPQVPRGVRLRKGNELLTPEEYASAYFAEWGYECLETESIPFHTLFAVFMWVLITDPADPLSETSWFGNRTDFENKVQPPSQVWIDKPPDFGTATYVVRRQAECAEHFSMIPHDREGLLGLFDLWTSPSEPLRQYLWAHRQSNLETARKLVEHLPPEWVHTILKYLLSNYWKHHLGWPDLLCIGCNDILFAEVKSSKDKLSEDQKRWIEDNKRILGFPFKLLKIHRQP